jgi:hypothetical protein
MNNFYKDIITLNVTYHICFTLEDSLCQRIDYQNVLLAIVTYKVTKHDQISTPEVITNFHSLG